MRKILLPLLMFPFLTWAQRLSDLNINVVLSDNGDARITEVRQMDITSAGTECYIIVGNLNGSTVKDLTVTDETGVTYITEDGNWDTSRSRAEKQNRCGIHQVDGGVEICWGLGEAGERTYTTSYTVTNLVQGYEDADGFNYMFVAQDINPKPENVTLTIAHEDTTRYEYGPVRTWAFRYKGTIEFEDGKIVAETDEPFSNGNAMIVMADFKKGIFHPDLTHGESFETVRQRALEGSDYEQESSNSSGFFQTLWNNFEVFFTAFILLLGAIWAGIVNPIKIRNRRRRLLGDEKQLLWYRGVPVNGNLKRSNSIINHLQVKNDYDNLLSAYILKLFYLDIIRFEQVQDRKGNLCKCFRIAPVYAQSQQNTDDEDGQNLRKLHEIFLQAAGADMILEPTELERYMNRNAKKLQPWAKSLHRNIPFSSIRQEEALQLFGLKKYLQEFTLSAERQIQEVHLWKDYLIFATLFGNAKQVMAELERIYPDYKKLDHVFSEFRTDRNSYLLYNSLLMSSRSGFQSAYSWTDPSARRRSGGGGWSSIGGGGGFSGGGSGGGIR